MSGILLTLERSSLDLPWGFRLQKTSDVFPPSVTRVSKNSQAEKCGLKAGDYFLKVKDIDVSHMTCADVMNIIKESKFKVPVVVIRESQCDNQSNCQEPSFTWETRIGDNGDAGFHVAGSRYNSTTINNNNNNNNTASSSNNNNNILNNSSFYSSSIISISPQPNSCITNGSSITAHNPHAKLFQRANSSWNSPTNLGVDWRGKENSSDCFKADSVVRTRGCHGDDGNDDYRKERFYKFPNTKDAGEERVADVSGIFPRHVKAFGRRDADEAVLGNPGSQQQQQELLHPLLMESLPAHLQQQLMSHLEAVMTNLQIQQQQQNHLHQQHQQQIIPYESYSYNNHSHTTYPTSPSQHNYTDLQSQSTVYGLNGYTTLVPPPEFMAPPTRPFSPSSIPTPVQSLEGESWLSFDPHSESPSSLSSFRPYLFDLTEQDLNQQNLYKQYFLEQQQEQYREMIQRSVKLPSPIDSLLSVDSIQPLSMRSSPLVEPNPRVIPPPPIPIGPTRFQTEPILILPPPSPFLEVSESTFLGDSERPECFPFLPQIYGYPGDVCSKSGEEQTGICHPMPLYCDYTTNNDTSLAQAFPPAPGFPGELQFGHGNNDAQCLQGYRGLSDQTVPGQYASFYFPQGNDIQCPESVERERNISRTSSTTPKFVSEFHSATSDDPVKETMPSSSDLELNETAGDKSLCVSELEIELEDDTELVETNEDTNSKQVALPVSDQILSNSTDQVVSEAYLDLEQVSSSTETLNFESKTFSSSEIDLLKDFNKEQLEKISKNTNSAEVSAIQSMESTSEQSTVHPVDVTFDSKRSSSDSISDKFPSSVTIREKSPSESPLPATTQTLNNLTEPNDSEPKQNHLEDNFITQFQTSNQDAHRNLGLESDKSESLPNTQVTSTTLHSEQETSLRNESQQRLPPTTSTTVLHTCPHCHLSLPPFDSPWPFWSPDSAFKSSSERENQTRNIQPPPAPPLPAGLLSPGEPKLQLTRRRSLQPTTDTTSSDPISGLSKARGGPGRAAWSYVPDKKVIEEQSQRIRQSLMKKYSRRASEVDLPTFGRETEKPSCIHAGFGGVKSYDEFNEDVFLNRVKRTSAPDQRPVDQPMSFQMLRRTFSGCRDNPPRPNRPRTASETPCNGMETQPMERIIYSGKKIPSRTFNRLETTMARKAEAEEMRMKSTKRLDDGE